MILSTPAAHPFGLAALRSRVVSTSARRSRRGSAARLSLTRRRRERCRSRPGESGAGELERPRAGQRRFGVWRSLVARSVRVGEVPSSTRAPRALPGGRAAPRLPMSARTRVLAFLDAELETAIATTHHGMQVLGARRRARGFAVSSTLEVFDRRPLRGTAAAVRHVLGQRAPRIGATCASPRAPVRGRHHARRHLPPTGTRARQQRASGRGCACE